MTTPSVTTPDVKGTSVDGAAGSAYDIDNLPYGVFVRGYTPGSACGSATWCSTWRRSRPPTRLDLAPVLAAPALNPLMAQGREAWTAVRRWVTVLLSDAAPRGRRAAPGAAGRGGAADAVRGR